MCRADFELSRCVAGCRCRVCRGLDSAANAPGEKHATLRRSSSLLCLACTWHGEVSGARCRPKIPPEGEIGKQSRRCLGTDNGLTPYSCLVPPRYFYR